MVEYKLVNAKSRGLQVFQAFNVDKWTFDYADFVVADAKTGPRWFDREFPCRSYGAAKARLALLVEHAEWAKAKAAADKTAKAAAKTAKAAEKAAGKAKAADAKLTAAPKEQKPNQMLLLKSELQQEMQAAIQAGIQQALATMQATAPSKPVKARKQPTANA